MRLALLLLASCAAPPRYPFRHLDPACAPEPYAPRIEHVRWQETLPPEPDGGAVYLVRPLEDEEPAP